MKPIAASKAPGAAPKMAKTVARTAAKTVARPVAKTALKPAAKPKATGPKRLAPQERERQIVVKAVEYFAAHGFSASTRDLAREIGVTQPLLYRYFPSKEALVDRVFDEVYLSRWEVKWEELLRDRGLSLRDRMMGFYQQYATVILKSDWIRIFIFAGLAREGINQRYLERLRERIFNVVLAELRHEFGLAEPTPQQYEDEIEFIWSLHASIFYVGVRKWIYALDVPADQERMIAQKVDAFLASAPQLLRMLRA